MKNLFTQTILFGGGLVAILFNKRWARQAVKAQAKMFPTKIYPTAVNIKFMRGAYIIMGLIFITLGLLNWAGIIRPR